MHSKTHKEIDGEIEGKFGAKRRKKDDTNTKGSIPTFH